MGDEGMTEGGPQRGSSSLGVQVAVFFVLGLAAGVSFGWGWSALPQAMLGRSPDPPIAPSYLTLSLAVLLMLAWAPLVDAVPAPFRRVLGQRRGWAIALACVATVVSALWWIAGPGPASFGIVLGLVTLAIAPGLLVAVDALRVDAAAPRHQGLLASAQVVGAVAGNYALSGFAVGDPGNPRSPVLLVLIAVWFAAAAVLLVAVLRAAAIPDHAAESRWRDAPSGLARVAWRVAGAAVAEMFRRLRGRLVAAAAGFVFAGLAASGTGLPQVAIAVGSGGDVPSPAFFQISRTVQANLDLFWALGGVVGALIALRWRPARAFAGALAVTAAVYGAALISSRLAVGGYGLMIAAAAVAQFLQGLLLVSGMAFAAILCRAPFTAVQFTLLMVVWTAATLAEGFWGGVAPKVLYLGRTATTELSLAVVLLAAVAGAVCVRRLRGDTGAASR